MSDDKINQELIKILVTKINKTQRTVYNRISKTQQTYKVNRRLASLILANSLGVNINRYIDDDADWDSIRSATGSLEGSSFQNEPNIPALSDNKIKVKKINHTYLNNFVDDGFINANDISTARLNAELYPLIYCFENSLRKFISSIMTLEYGNDWWETKIKVKNGKIHGNVEGRKKQTAEYPWHDGRNPDPIFLTDIKDLKTIINCYGSQGKFQKILGNKKERVLVWIEDIELTRNVLAHNNKVSRKDRDRLTQYAKDWHEFAREKNKEISSNK